MFAAGGCHVIVMASSLTSFPVEITVAGSAMRAAGSISRKLENAARCPEAFT
jgi:hypothetical protein